MGALLIQLFALCFSSLALDPKTGASRTQHSESQMTVSQGQVTKAIVSQANTEDAGKPDDVCIIPLEGTTKIGTRAFLKCVEQKHPAILQARQKSQSAKAEIGIAGQRPNPDLELQNVNGDKLGDKTTDFSAQLVHTFELGGKRGARMGLAESRAGLFDLQIRKATEDAFLPVLSALYRLSQIQSESKILQDSQSAWIKIARNLKARMALTPEQTASLTIFELAIIDSRAGLSQLANEESDLRQELEHAVRSRVRLSLFNLPKLQKPWPQFPEEKKSIISQLDDSENSDLGKAVEVQMGHQERIIAEKELAVQQAMSWPNVSVGPAISYIREGPISDTQIGVKLAMPLPVYHWNGAGRNWAQLEKTRTDSSYKMNRETLALMRARELSQYERAVKTLEESEGFERVQKEYQRVQALFSRGVLPSGIVIEAHRQMIESTRSLNKQEMVALGSLWNLRKMMGEPLYQEVD